MNDHMIHCGKNGSTHIFDLQRGAQPLCLLAYNPIFHYGEITTINPSYGSYKPTERYQTGAPHCRKIQLEMKNPTENPSGNPLFEWIWW